MPEMKLSIQLSKVVQSAEEGETLFEMVRSYMEQYPQVFVRGSVSTHFPIPEEVPDDD